MRALIVDDDVVVQGVMKAYLLLYGEEREEVVQVQVLPDALQALDLLSEREHDFDVILLDVNMPKMHGDELYSQLMSVKPEILNRILFITAYRDNLVARFPDIKLNILDKPFRYQRLVDAMATLPA